MSKKDEGSKAALPENEAILSNEEKAAIRREVLEELEAKRKEAATTDFRKRETLRLQKEEGFVTGNAVKDEMVNIHLDLAPHSADIKINGTHYFHGRSYAVARHVADTLNEIQHRGWKHQNEIDGKSMTDFFGQKRVADMFDVKRGKNIGVVLDPKGAAQRLG